ncbi:MAG TPA: hypothetical protein VMV92_24455 [Streptosporangiaceae bacterium]|nr:hypothetical protein [Streptosporangiaceae bacterium]
MAIIIEEYFMRAEFNGSVIATASCASGDRWTIDADARRFTRNQAITAMVLADYFAEGYGDDDPFVIGWREELR